MYFSNDTTKCHHVACLIEADLSLSEKLPLYESHISTIHGKAKQVKVHSYVVRYPVRRIAQSALHFTTWQTCSFQCQFFNDFYGKHSATL